MVKIKNKNLIKILLILLIFLLFLLILKLCKITHFCCIFLSLISPIFIGFAIAWLIKPIMLYFNKYFNIVISSIITYLLLAVMIFLIGFFLIPIVSKEIKNIIPLLVKIYDNMPKEITRQIDFTKVSKRVVLLFNNTKDVILNIFYSILISYYFLVDHKKVTSFISRYTPSKLVNDISNNLKLFVKGTLLDTLILFVMSIICFYFVKMPYPFLFSIVISITNLIPFVGPYIGGIPAFLVALSVNYRFGLLIGIIILVLQFIESSFIHPIIMSKSLKISPIFIIIGLIVFGYLFGIIGMLISTPIVSIIKSLLDYYKPFKKVLYK